MDLLRCHGVVPIIPFVLRPQHVVVRSAELAEGVAHMSAHVVRASHFHGWEECSEHGHLLRTRGFKKVVEASHGCAGEVSGGTLEHADEGSVCVVVGINIVAFPDAPVHGRDWLVVVCRGRA